LKDYRSESCKHFDPGGIAMLVLSRRAGERIQIGDRIEVTVVRIGPGVVRIGIEAPSEMPVMREEIRQGLPTDSRQGPSQRAGRMTSEIEISTGSSSARAVKNCF
jgi:carbon storage regulator